MCTCIIGLCFFLPVIILSQANHPLKVVIFHRVYYISYLVLVYLHQGNVHVVTSLALGLSIMYHFTAPTL